MNARPVLTTVEMLGALTSKVLTDALKQSTLFWLSMAQDLIKVSLQMLKQTSSSKSITSKPKEHKEGFQNKPETALNGATKEIIE